MGFIKSIYFDDNLQEKIKGEENLSRLISKLLNEYYANKIFTTDIDKQLDIIRSQSENTIKKLKDQENELLRVKELKEKEEYDEVLTIEQQQAKEKRLIQNLINSAKEVFNVEMTEDQAKGFKLSKFDVLLDYLIDIGVLDGGDYK